MSFLEDKLNDLIDDIERRVKLYDDDYWTDPNGILESIGIAIEDFRNTGHDPSKPLGPEHDCCIVVRGCDTYRECFCNATGGMDHHEDEFSLIGSNGKPY